MIFEKFKFFPIKRRLKIAKNKELFTWTHRYLRLHEELLEDPIYKNMFERNRIILVSYLKKDIKSNRMTDEQLGELVDALADVFNKSYAERVNTYKPIVEDLYELWKSTFDI